MSFKTNKPGAFGLLESMINFPCGSISETVMWVVCLLPSTSYADTITSVPDELYRNEQLGTHLKATAEGRESVPKFTNVPKRNTVSSVKMCFIQ